MGQEKIMKFLVIVAEENTSNVVCDALKSYQGISLVEKAFDGERGLAMATANHYDFIVLHLAIPKINGRNFIIKLRQTSNVPILVLSENGDFNLAADILEKGADDFIANPFQPVEFLARIKAILRRCSNDFGANKYVYKNLQVDFFEKVVEVDGERVDVVAKMYEMFEYLLKRKNIIVSKDTLFNRVWGFESETGCSVVEVYMSKLRKILAKGGLHNHLVTVKNAGYMWTDKD